MLVAGAHAAEPPARAAGDPVERFRRLLELYRVAGAKSGAIVTHTSLADPPGAYHVPGSSNEHFLQEYAAAVEAGARLHLTERQGTHYAVLVDLDFRFAAAGDGPPSRRFDAAFVRAAAAAYGAAIRGMLTGALHRRGEKLDGEEMVETMLCHVQQRDAPYVDRGVVKDGVHLVFSNVSMTSAAQRAVRERALPALAALLRERLPGLLNAADDVVDACTTRNNWMLLGSRKPGREPYRDVAVLSLGVGGAVAELPPDAAVLDTLARVSGRVARHPTALTLAARELLRGRADAEAAARQAALLRREGFQAHRNTVECRSADADLARRLVELLSPRRADSYDSWMRVGWCLRNIDASLLPQWDAFSQQSPKYQPGVCDGLWPHYRNEHGLGLGTLNLWAREDAPERYDALRAERGAGLLDAAVATMAHFDVARVVFDEYKDVYVCTSVAGGQWYRFSGHRWHAAPKAIGLRTALSVEIHDAFQRRARAVQRESDSDNAGEVAKAVGRYIELCRSLRVTGFKDSVMREACDMFYRERFEGALDSKPHLIGFENGVYDLDAGVFRAGAPDDMVSMSTGHDYAEVPASAPEYGELERFFAAVFPDGELRRYFLSRMAAYISGHIIKEEFLILTGSGSNGKSKTIELLQHALGEYAVNLPTALLTQRRGASNAASPEVARLKGRRLAVMQEPSDNDRLNLSILKEATGSDVMQARPLYGEPFEFRPQFSMVLTCNTLPIVPDNDGGTWRRIKVVEFGSKFTTQPDPDDDTHFPIDLHLSDKFPRWRAAFVCLMLRLHREGRNAPAREPDAVNRACEEYRSEQDVFAQFVADSFTKTGDPADRLPLTEVHRAYRAWAKARMMSPTTQRLAASALAKKVAPALGKLRCAGAPQQRWTGWAAKAEADDY